MIYRKKTVKLWLRAHGLVVPETFFTFLQTELLGKATYVEALSADGAVWPAIEGPVPSPLFNYAEVKQQLFGDGGDKDAVRRYIENATRHFWAVMQVHLRVMQQFERKKIKLSLFQLLWVQVMRTYLREPITVDAAPAKQLLVPQVIPGTDTHFC